MLFIFFLLVTVISFFVYVKIKNKPEKKNDPDEFNPKTVAKILKYVLIVFALLSFLCIFTVIPAGRVGVIDFFGTVSKTTLKAGINVMNPFAKAVKFSIKTQEIKEVMEVPSKEGLTVTLEISGLLHLDPEKAAEVYKTIGTNYVEIIFEPNFRSVARGVTATYEAKALYTSEREMLAQLILKDLEKLVAPRGIVIESILLRKIGLPGELSKSIENKLVADQESQRMEFVLTKERQEAKRKAIEAEGIAAFQLIVTKGISEQLLKWKGIEATEKLAASQNTKIVIIGSGKDGLPIILNSDK